ncbi:MAG: AbrB family transcriptional regulator [Bifidobacterium sp.]|uniref:AbrB family transcriptional regulator n=1 Tax=Bifidobacterium fermentum TaxID=3059035 RepID=A0AB39UH18_9BIFI
MNASDTVDEADAESSCDGTDPQAVLSTAEQSDVEAQETLNVSYERLRHSTDSTELSDMAHAPLPDSSDQAAFSRSTALLEAVAGNPNTPVEDRVFLAERMPFPNVLVKLSTDSEADVRAAVAGNASDKNWLVGRLAKDADARVRSAALQNPQASWRIRLEGAQTQDLDAQTLAYLATLGTENEGDAPVILATMVRQAVAQNSGTDERTLRTLSEDSQAEVAGAARHSLQGLSKDAEKPEE